MGGSQIKNYKLAGGEKIEGDSTKEVEGQKDQLKLV